MIGETSVHAICCLPLTVAAAAQHGIGDSGKARSPRAKFIVSADAVAGELNQTVQSRCSITLVMMC